MSNSILNKRVPEQYAFILLNGHKVHTLSELLSEIKDMDQNHFSHFVHSSHNHFANWIEDIFEFEDLPNALRSVKTKSQTIKVLEETLIPIESAKPSNTSKTSKSVQEKAPSKPKEPVIKTVPKSKQNPLAEKTKHIDEHIDHLHKNLSHVTRYDTHTPNHTAKSYEPVTEEIRDKLVDFGFGLVIGLIIGLLLAKGLGVF